MSDTPTGLPSLQAQIAYMQTGILPATVTYTQMELAILTSLHTLPLVEADRDTNAKNVQILKDTLEKIIGVWALPHDRFSGFAQQMDQAMQDAKAALASLTYTFPVTEDMPVVLGA